MNKINLDTYLLVLQNEVDTLKEKYYKPQSEGTGCFNTAIYVLENRIKDLKNGISNV
jgi:hypothetical protein